MSRRVGYHPAMSSEQSWGDWYNEHALLLNPLAVGAAVGVLGVLDSLTLPLWWQTTAILASVDLAVYAWTIGIVHVQQRVYYRLVLLACTVWVLLLHTPWAAEHWQGFGVAWVCATILGGIGYWNDQRVKEKIKISKERDSWPALAKIAGIPKAWLTPKRPTASGYERTLSWPPGEYTLEQIKSLREKIEGVLNIPYKQMRFVEVKDADENTAGDRLVISVGTQSKARKAPVPFTEPTMTSITDKMVIGPYESQYEGNDDCTIVWYEQGYGGAHTLAAGATRSGKSGLYHLMMAESAACQDVVRWGIDAKGGMALRPWAPMFDWLICGESSEDRAQWAAMFSRLNAILEYREKFAAERGWGVWKVSKKFPLIILYVDEIAEVTPMRLEALSVLELIEKVGRKGAGVGVLLCCATQYPTLDAIGSSQVQANILRRFCFRVLQKEHQYVTIPGSTNVDCMFPDKPTGAKGAGWYYMRDQGKLHEIPARVRYVNEFQIYDTVCTYWQNKGQLDPGSANVAVAREIYDARKKWTPADLIDPRKSDEDWTDEEDHMEYEIPEQAPPVAATAGNGAGTRPGTTAGTSAGNMAGTTGTGDLDPLVADGINGPDVPLDAMFAHQSPDDLDAFEEARRAWNAQHAEWPQEKATAEFWRVFQMAGETGVRVGKLAELCHRSTSWTHALRGKAQLDGAIEPIATGSPYYRLTSIDKVPEQYRLVAGNAG